MAAQVVALAPKHSHRKVGDDDDGDEPTHYSSPVCLVAFEPAIVRQEASCEIAEIRAAWFIRADDAERAVTPYCLTT
jgi:hypothetical protein